MNREDIEPDDTKALVVGLASQWDLGQPEFVRAFDNTVYRLGGEANPHYLRLSSARRRSRLQVKSELDMLSFLASRDFPASAPVPTRDGSTLLEVSSDSGAVFLAALFTNSPGSDFFAHPPDDLESFVFRVGKTMATLHRELRSFPRPAGFERSHWKQDRWKQFEAVVPRSETSAWDFYLELFDWLNDQPTTQEQFGLIHGDFTVANLRFAPGNIHLFDFDASCDHWYAYELAAFLHLFGINPPEQRRKVYDALLSGYSSITPLPPGVLEQIPIFAKMRLLYSYLMAVLEWGFQNLSEKQEAYFEHRRRLFKQPSVWPERPYLV